MSNTYNQQTTSTTEEQNNTNSTIKNMEDTKWKKWGVILAFIASLIGNLITAGVLIYNANQQHQDKQEEMQLKNEEACIVKVDKKYETIYDIKQKLRDHVSKIEDLHNKWILAQENTEVFSDEEKKQILNIFNDLTYIHDEVPQGKALKDEMEEWLIKFNPSIQGYSSLFSFDTHYVVTLANISSREEIPTPKTGGILSLEKKEKEYIYFYIDFIDGKVKDCVEDNK